MKPKTIITVCFVVIAGIFLGVWSWKHRAPEEDESPPNPPLTVAAMNDDISTLDALEAGGADLNAGDPNRFGWTPLIAAVHFQSTNVVMHLLKKGVDVNKLDNSDNTALMHSITTDDTNVGWILLQYSGTMDWATISNFVAAKEKTSNLWFRLIAESQRNF